MSRIERYTCEEVLRRLDDFLDRELSDEEMRLVHEHMETCAACASEHAFEDGVIAQMRDKLRRIDMPLALRDRITRMIELEGLG